MKVFHNFTLHAVSCWHDVPELMGAGDDHINVLPTPPGVGAAPTLDHPGLVTAGASVPEGALGPTPPAPPGCLPLRGNRTSTGRSHRAWRLPETSLPICLLTPRGRPDPTPRQPPGGTRRSAPYLQPPWPREKLSTGKCLPFSPVCSPRRLGARSCSPGAEFTETPLIYSGSRLPAPGRPRGHLSHKQTARNSLLMRSLVGAHFRHNCERDTKL